MTLQYINQKLGYTVPEYFNSFLFRIPHSPLTKGINLYSSKNNINFKLRQRYLTKNLLTSSGYIYFPLDSQTHDDDGRTLYFQAEYINSFGNVVNLSSTGIVHTIPTNVDDVKVRFNGKTLAVNWNSVDVLNGKNYDVNKYLIYKGILSVLNGFSLSNKNDTSFTINLPTYYTALIVIRRNSQATWKLFLNNQNTITLSNDNLLPGYNPIKDYNNLFIEELSMSYSDGSETLIAEVPNNVPPGIGRMQIGTTFVVYDNNFDPTSIEFTYYDPDFGYGLDYYYIVSTASDYQISTAVISREFAHTYNIISTSPKLLLLTNSDDFYLNNEYWQVMKDALIDSNYYDKSSLAIPYLEKRTYNLKGYLGITSTNILILINSKLITTVITDGDGVFSVDLNLIKGLNSIDLYGQINNDNVITTSEKSSTYNYRTYNIYSQFSAYGNQIQFLYDQNTLTENKFYLNKTDDIENSFGYMMDLPKSVLETSTAYISFVKNIYPTFTNSGYKAHILEFMDRISEIYSDIIDHYMYFDNMDPYRTWIIATDYLTYPGFLPRWDYTYGVSAVNSIGEETDIVEVRADKRWMPDNSETIVGLEWVYSSTAIAYNIYKKYTTTSSVSVTYGLLKSNWPHTKFFDLGILPINTSIQPKPLNYTEFNAPSNLREIKSVVFNDIKKYGYGRMFDFTLFIFAKKSIKWDSFHADRIMKYLREIYPIYNLNIVFAQDDGRVVYSN